MDIRFIEHQSEACFRSLFFVKITEYEREKLEQIHTHTQIRSDYVGKNVDRMRVCMVE